MTTTRRQRAHGARFARLNISRLFCSPYLIPRYFPLPSLVRLLFLDLGLYMIILPRVALLVSLILDSFS